MTNYKIIFSEIIRKKLKQLNKRMKKNIKVNKKIKINDEIW